MEEMGMDQDQMEEYDQELAGEYDENMEDMGDENMDQMEDDMGDDGYGAEVNKSIFLISKLFLGR